MPPPSAPTLKQHLAWAYANLAMAEKATHDREQRFSRLHYMIRAKLYRGLLAGSMVPRSLMRDQRIRMKLPQQCVYCGSLEALAVDHVVPQHRGGADVGDNVVWACRPCNSSKRDHDLFRWWEASRNGLPPLFVVRIYLKQAIVYANEQGLVDQPLENLVDHPFDFAAIPTIYPQPSELIFTPYHHDRDVIS